MIEGAFDPIDHCVQRLVRPQPKHGPAGLTESRVVSSVSRDVRIELRPPPGAVRLRVRPVFWASMPKTAVDEHGDAPPREDRIGSTAKACQRREVLPEAEPALVQLGSEGDLDRAFRPVAEHHASSSRRRWPWGRRDRRHHALKPRLFRRHHIGAGTRGYQR